jgi:hypothetical protein
VLQFDRASPESFDSSIRTLPIYDDRLSPSLHLV